MSNRKLSILLSLTMAVTLTACSSSSAAGSDIPATSSTAQLSDATEDPVELIVFAASSMTGTLNSIIRLYKAANPNITFSVNFDSSGTLKSQIEEGADCDIFISASQKQMDALDIAANSDANPQGLDFILSGTRFDLVSNSVVLIVPEGNPSGVTSFEDLMIDKVSLIALGNADVPVGQYSSEIFTSIGMWDQLTSDQKITYGTNVKEVLAQVVEGAVDCGVVYSTDAAAADVLVVASAPSGSHKDITYPAAVLAVSDEAEAAQAFLEYLVTDECSDVFESAGFTIPN
jgi:molybdate transport system substrate-binding protein